MGDPVECEDDDYDPSDYELPPRPGYNLSTWEMDECKKVYTSITKMKAVDRNAILWHLIQGYKKSELYEFLQFNREITIDELKIYYLFLREYFAPKTNHKVFESKKLLVRHLRKCILKIRETRESWEGHVTREAWYLDDNDEYKMTYLDTPRPHAYDTKFLSTNENHIHGLLSNLEGKQLIKRLPREKECKLYPQHFPALVTKKETWKLKTFQPAENEYDVPIHNPRLRHGKKVILFPIFVEERAKIISDVLRGEGDWDPL